jgi:hypothetical protein
MVDLEPPDLTKMELKGDLQDGMLAWYQSQAPLQDAQIEARVDREPLFLSICSAIRKNKRISEEA